MNINKLYDFFENKSEICYALISIGFDEENCDFIIDKRSFIENETMLNECGYEAAICSINKFNAHAVTWEILDIIKDLKMNGCDKWRIPTAEEIKKLRTYNFLGSNFIFWVSDKVNEKNCIINPDGKVCPVYGTCRFHFILVKDNSERK